MLAMAKPLTLENRQGFPDVFLCTYQKQAETMKDTLQGQMSLDDFKRVLLMESKRRSVIVETIRAVGGGSMNQIVPRIQSRKAQHNHGLRIVDQVTHMDSASHSFLTRRPKWTKTTLCWIMCNG